MKKPLLLLLMAGFLAADSASAQNSTYRYKTNNRNATESVDAAVYNPAGLIWLEDGFHIEIGNQFGYGTKEIYDGLTGTTYEATGGGSFDPTAILIYKIMTSISISFSQNPCGILSSVNKRSGLAMKIISGEESLFK